jgi:hypothetical protein
MDRFIMVQELEVENGEPQDKSEDNDEEKYPLKGKYFFDCT